MATGTSWADEMDELPSAPAPRDFSDSGAPGAFGARPMRSRFEENGSFSRMREEPPLPTEPPFTAFVVNLSFESTESDVQNFFEPLTPVSVRLVSGHDGRPRGYGYVEFSTLDELKEALTYTGRSMDNRNVRVSVAESSSRAIKGAAADDASQWRRATPLPGGDDRRSGFGGVPSGGGFDSMGVTADGTRGGFGSKFEQSAERPRRGMAEPAEPGRGDDASDWRTGKPVVNKGPRFGFGSGEGRERSRPPLDEDGHSTWRSARPAATASERRKLDLKPRNATPSSTSAASVSSPFGSAKPVDVAEREREIQEKIQTQDRAWRASHPKTEKKPSAPDGAWRKADSASTEKRANDSPKVDESTEKDVSE
ncbi:hypothetical protein MVES_000228 [Malassezia vespertilionis]|uniref:RRM domain-containing protein n=1 Tax=Malassezia vespertilionis TaxID=2020962 RepID=A0A2N1JFM3_9BASI|nr:hypothetical protein MVES_000228 [Malassezia vespertilionis]